MLKKSVEKPTKNDIRFCIDFELQNEAKMTSKWDGKKWENLTLGLLGGQSGPQGPKATHGTPRALKTKPKAPPKPKKGPQNSPRTRQKVHKQPQTRRTTNEKNKKTHTHKPAHKHKPNKSTTEQPKWRGSAECAKRLNNLFTMRLLNLFWTGTVLNRTVLNREPCVFKPHVYVPRTFCTLSQNCFGWP